MVDMWLSRYGNLLRDWSLRSSEERRPEVMVTLCLIQPSRHRFHLPHANPATSVMWLQDLLLGCVAVEHRKGGVQAGTVKFEDSELQRN